jgi:hypothetical protein
MTWVGLRIWVSSIRKRKKHKGKTLEKQPNTEMSKGKKRPF